MMVLGIILAVFIVLLVLPVGVGVAYDDQAGPQVRLLAGPVKILVYPRKKRNILKKRAKKKPSPSPSRSQSPRSSRKSQALRYRTVWPF